jgi:hypothetical protein
LLARLLATGRHACPRAERVHPVFPLPLIFEGG